MSTLINFVYVLIFFLSSLSLAQEEEAPQLTLPPASFAGVIQFIKGNAEKKWGDSWQSLKFKSILKFKDVIRIPKSSHLKIITSQRCVSVIFGPATIHAPQGDKQPLWKLNSQSARWICQDGQEQILSINSNALKLSGGELLFHKNKIFVRRARLISKNGELVNKGLYSWSNYQWLLDDSPNSKLEAWNLNRDLPQPVESLAAGEKPLRIAKSRWMMGLLAGGGSMSHDNSHFDIKDAELHGIRIGTQQISSKRDRAYYGSLTFYEVESSRANEFEGQGSQQEPNLFSRMNVFNIDVGIRWKGQRAWSFYSGGGIGHVRYDIDYYDNINMFKADFEIDYLAANIHSGIDYIVGCDWLGWGGIRFSIEAFLNRTLFSTEKNEGPNNYNSSIDEGITHTGIMFHIAPLLQF